MADGTKKEIRLNAGLSQDKIREMAGRTLAAGGMPAEPRSGGASSSGGLKGIFNDAAKSMTEPTRPSSAMSAPKGPKGPMF